MFPLNQYKTFAPAEAYVRDTQRRKIKSWKSYQAIIEKHLLRVWENRKARSIERRDVIKVIDKARRSPGIDGLDFCTALAR